MTVAAPLAESGISPVHHQACTAEHCAPYCAIRVEDIQRRYAEAYAARDAARGDHDAWTAAMARLAEVGKEWAALEGERYPGGLDTYGT